MQDGPRVNQLRVVHESAWAFLLLLHIVALSLHSATLLHNKAASTNCRCSVGRDIFRSCLRSGESERYLFRMKTSHPHAVSNHDIARTRIRTSCSYQSIYREIVYEQEKKRKTDLALDSHHSLQEQGASCFTKNTLHGPIQTRKHQREISLHLHAAHVVRTWVFPFALVKSQGEARYPTDAHIS
ncbi:hypothetical protein DFH29DRAFT_644476 [Suillus ampliporus]|nr:hypothetical protein DFH29DRAFT_644476 [Suillus ampliporus]